MLDAVLPLGRAVLPLGRADLVQALALPLPMAVIGELLGVPDTDRNDFHGWSSDMVAPRSPQAGAAAAQAMTRYLAGLIDTKRGKPGSDLLSALVHTTDGDGDDGLSPEEMLGMAFLLLVAGHETTVNLISGGAATLLRHPAQLAALRADWALLEGAVEEMLRHHGPAAAAAFRFAAEPVEIAGTTVPAGESVLIALNAADRDPSRFTDPDRFDVHRDTRGHLAFGHGIHHCLGAPLGRMEAAIALRTLFRRCPDLTLDTDPANLTRRPGLLGGLERLPVRYTPVPGP